MEAAAPVLTVNACKCSGGLRRSAARRPVFRHALGPACLSARPLRTPADKQRAGLLQRGRASARFMQLSEACAAHARTPRRKSGWRTLLKHAVSPELDAAVPDSVGVAPQLDRQQSRHVHAVPCRHGRAVSGARPQLRLQACAWRCLGACMSALARPRARACSCTTPCTQTLACLASHCQQA